VNIDVANPTARVGGDAVDVKNKLIPEVDISYFFTSNLAAELILTYPQKHDVELAGSKIGSFKHLPPTLTLQYHFIPQADLRPYVGAGVNYTHISSVNLLGGAADLGNDSWGGALQFGFDYKVGANSYINFDVKKVYIQSDLMVGGANAATVNVDPLLLGIGYGYRF
jgi:outer membrane protein